MKIREIECRSAIGKCGFPGGGFAINPYVGCSHNCLYCYARFMRRFTNHTEPWGTFVDVRVNVAAVLQRQLKSAKYKEGPIYVGTVTDPYQPVENKYRLARQILSLLKDYGAPVSLLTKSDLVLRDVDLLRQFREVDVNFTITTLDERWKRLTEPGSPTVSRRLAAARRLTAAGIPVNVMVGPYWPFFTDAAALFKKFQAVGVQQVFAESFNSVGGNWTGVEAMMRRAYPELLPKLKGVIFDRQKFADFYDEQAEKIKNLSQKYRLPATVYFGQGHAAKFK